MGTARKELSLKARKRWSLVLLLVALPVYVIVAVSLLNWLYPDPLSRPPVLVEVGIYVGLGILWALPFRFVFRGVGQADPDQTTPILNDPPRGAVFIGACCRLIPSR